MTREIPDGAVRRIGGHLELIQRLASMVASELVVADGLSEAEALMAMSQVFIACGAHTAVFAANEHLQRPADYWKWKDSCDAAFRRAVAKRTELSENVATGRDEVCA